MDTNNVPCGAFASAEEGNMGTSRGRSMFQVRGKNGAPLMQGLLLSQVDCFIGMSGGVDVLKYSDRRPSRTPDSSVLVSCCQ
eukprot:1158945-Pelagomonas_calceolata.AAC.5